MPIVGEEKSGKELGYKTNTRFFGVACTHCGKVRWMPKRLAERRVNYCRPCSDALFRSLDKNFHWKGGKSKDKKGYIHIKLSSDDIYFLMANSEGYIFEHRLVMAKSLGRCLKPKETIHHLNGIKDDNSKENLTIVTNKSHPSKTFIKQLQKRIRELEQLHLLGVVLAYILTEGMHVGG